MKTRKTIIAASIAAMLVVPLTVSAKAKWEYHEGQWNEVISYGNVSLAEDSAQQWGPWSEFVQPAAGGPSVVFLPQVAELYRPLPKTDPTPTPTPTPVDDFCKSGEWCGYAVFRNESSSWSNSDQEGGEGGRHEYTYTRPHPARIAFALNPDDPSITAGNGTGPGSAAWRIASLSGLTPLFGESGLMPAQFGGTWWWSGSSDEGLHTFYASRYTSSDSGYEQAWAYGVPHDYYWWYYLPTNNEEVAVGWFGRSVSNYMSGGDGYRSGGDGSESGVYGYYVAGITTPQAYLDAQRIGNVIATYSGSSMDMSGCASSVNMTVDFGKATWSGSWNNGTNGYTYTQTASDGTQYLQGNVGFNASGTISGANIQSTSVSALDTKAVSGSVQGTFFGQQAGSVGGVHDIVKDNLPHTGVFLVDKVVAQ